MDEGRWTMARIYRLSSIVYRRKADQIYDSLHLVGMTRHVGSSDSSRTSRRSGRDLPAYHRPHAAMIRPVVQHAARLPISMAHKLAEPQNLTQIKYAYILLFMSEDTDLIDDLSINIAASCACFNIRKTARAITNLYDA